MLAVTASRFQKPSTASVSDIPLRSYRFTCKEIVNRELSHGSRLRAARREVEVRTSNGNLAETSLGAAP